MTPIISEADQPKKKGGRPRKLTGRPLKATSLGLEPEMIEELQALAIEEGKASVSEIVRQLLKEGLQRREKRKTRREKQVESQELEDDSSI